ncbi:MULTISPECIES: hemolysin XhlA [Serratia]|uniref:hemolysin XhlA n=1 Tax=Serratia TaxID=613 RepID=UPI001EE6A139|nr:MULTISPECIES: hemolysin XhlA [Serratia]MDP8858634.1 hemolysin XhlA [Serratia marcescens]
MSNSKISYIRGTSPESVAGQFSDDSASFQHGGGNGGGNDMLDRVKKLEDQVLTLVTDIAVIKSNYVTKADLHEEISKQTKWIAATIIGTTGLALTVAKLIF